MPRETVEWTGQTPAVGTARLEMGGRPINRAKENSMHALLIMSLLGGVTIEPYGQWESTVVKSAARRAEKSVGRRLSTREISALVAAAPPIPFREVTVAVELRDGTIWAGSPRGLMRRKKESRWRLFHSRAGSWTTTYSIFGLSAVTPSMS